MLHCKVLHRWTVSIIEQHCHLVEAVAKALLERRQLSGPQLLDVIRVAYQEQVRALLDAAASIWNEEG